MKKLSIILIAIFAVFNMGCSKQLGDDFNMLAKVINNGEKLEVEVLESENNASGIYLVIIANETEFIDKVGNQILKENIECGDIVEIYYGGQVMMSYPPQIVAARIVIK